MPKFQKGHPGGPGRPKGLGNKVATEARRHLAKFINGESKNLKSWVESIQDPKEKVDAYAKILPYVMPKMQLVEISETGTAYDPMMLTADEQLELARLETRRRELLAKCTVMTAGEVEDAWNTEDDESESDPS
jgi:hypothetical protein